MQYLNWTLTSLLFLMAVEHYCLVPVADRSGKRDTCVALVAQRHFRNNSTVAILTPDVHNRQNSAIVKDQPRFLEDSLVQDISLGKNFSLVILQWTISKKNYCYCLDTLNDRKSVDYFIMLGREEEIASCIKTFCFDNLISDNSNFVVYIETNLPHIRALVDGVLEAFWSHQQQNVIVLVANQQGEINAYHGFPLDNTPSVRIVEKCDGEALRKNTPLFHTLPHDLNGKFVKVGMMVSPPHTCQKIGGGFAGFDIDIVEAMATELNFTMKYFRVKDLKTANESDNVPWRGLDGAWNSVLRSVMSGEVDIGLGGFVLTPERLDGFSYTQPYFRDTTQFFSTTDLIPSHSIERWIWLVGCQIASVHICTSLAMHFIKRGVGRRTGDFGATAIMVWSLITEVACKTSHLSQRQALLWTVCAFFAINMNTAYKSFLTSVLTRPIYTEKIQSVTDMILSDLPLIRNSPIFETDTGVLSSEDINKLSTRLSTCPKPLYRCLYDYLSVPHYSISAFTLTMEFIGFALPNRSYHSLGTTIASYDISIYTRKNFFLSRKMTTMMLRSAQAGLVDYWYLKNLRNHKMCDLNEYHWSVLRNADANKSLPENYADKAAHPFSVDELHRPFEVLGLGLILAGVSLILELFTMTKCYRFLRNRLKRIKYCIRNTK